MKKRYNCLVACCILSATLICAFSVPKIAIASTESAIIIEVHTGRVLYENNADEQKPMASTTKILTAITVIENVDNLDKTVIVPKSCVGIEGSSIYLIEGEELSYRQLLYGLMLRSGNDCAETLAVATSGTIENFAKIMNETAAKIGATHSNFVNPHGLHDKKHYTTARDLAKISAYAMKNQIFREIVSTKKINIPWKDHDYPRVLINKNKMLSSFDGAIGIKTGYTKVAGRCLVSSAKRGNEEYVCVVLNCGNMFEKSTSLLENAFRDYEFTAIIKPRQQISTIDVGDDKKLSVGTRKAIYYPLRKEELKKIDFRIIMNDDIKIPLDFNQSVGKIEIYLENQLIFCEKLFTILEAENLGEKNQYENQQIFSGKRCGKSSCSRQTD